MNFWNNDKLTDEEKNKLLVAACRRVFSTEDGKIVLNMLLTDLYYFTAAPDEGGEALNEYAKFFIRERLGVRDTVALSNAIVSEAETAASRGGK
jgi:hypothetical protein